MSFDLKLIKRITADIVKGNENNVAHCYYVDAVARQPMCIVGHIFSELGMLENFPLMFNGEPLGDLPAKYRAEFTEDAINYMQILQNVQDNGQPWDEALEEANSRFKG